MMSVQMVPLLGAQLVAVALTCKQHQPDTTHLLLLVRHKVGTHSMLGSKPQVLACLTASVQSYTSVPDCLQLATVRWYMVLERMPQALRMHYCKQ